MLAKERFAVRGRDVQALGAHFVPFSAHTRMSGVDLDGRRVRKGAAEAIERLVVEQGVQKVFDRHHVVVTTLRLTQREVASDFHFGADVHFSPNPSGSAV